MPGFKLNIFSGLRPRIPAALLPANAATVAENCDFAYGELRNSKDGYAYLTMNNTVKGLYTEDGLAFYTWDKDINAVRSPVVGDTFSRMYYTGDTGGMRVASRLGTTTSGGVPSSSYLVGVPAPTVAPQLNALPPVALTGANCTMAFRFHWEYGGVKYQEQAINPTRVDDFNCTFTAPAKADATPATAFPVLRLTATALTGTTQICDIYTNNSSLNGTGGYYSLSISSQDSSKDLTKQTAFKATLETSVKESEKEARAYVYTYVNSYGEEGPPSPPAIVDSAPGLTVQVTVTKDSITGYAPISKVRVYRTAGTTVADYFFVGEAGIAASSTFMYTDTTRAELLGEAITSTDYYPPNPALTGLMALHNGILCAWKGNEIHFSEPYKPWAWNPANVKTVPTGIVVGGIAHGAGALITTTTHPCWISGVSPNSMTVSRVNVDQAGVSKWSICVVDGYVMYASNDGIVAVSGATATLNSSEKFFTRDKWRERIGSGMSSLRFAVWDGRLVAYSSSGLFTPFMIRFDEAEGTMTDLPSFHAACSFVSALSDQFYYAYGNTLYQFNGGNGLTATWESAERVMPRPINFGAGQAIVDGDWTIEIYAFKQRSATDRTWSFERVCSQQVSTGVNNFRLPGGFESSRYKVKLIGTGGFRELRIASNFKELAAL